MTDMTGMTGTAPQPLHPFDGRPFTLRLLDGNVTFDFAGDATAYEWGGLLASREDPSRCTICRVDFRVGATCTGDGIAVTEEVEAELAAFFGANGLDWASEKATIDAIRAQHPIPIANDPVPDAQAPIASIIPPNHEPVAVSPEIAAQLPAGTQVSTNEAGQLVASVPTNDHENPVIHLVHEGEAAIEHLIETVKKHFAAR